MTRDEALVEIARAERLLRQAEDEIRLGREQRMRAARHVAIVEAQDESRTVGIEVLPEPWAAVDNARLAGLRQAVARAKAQLADIDRQAAGVREALVDFRDCLTADGAEVRLFGVGRGIISGTFGPFREITLSTPIDLLTPGQREVNKIFIKASDIRFVGD